MREIERFQVFRSTLPVASLKVSGVSDGSVYRHRAATRLSVSLIPIWGVIWRISKWFRWDGSDDWQTTICTEVSGNVEDLALPGGEWQSSRRPKFAKLLYGKVSFLKTVKTLLDQGLSIIHWEGQPGGCRKLGIARERSSPNNDEGAAEDLDEDQDEGLPWWS